MTPSSEQIISAIRLARIRPNWKPGSGQRHLLKRKLRGQLAAEAARADYNRIIRQVLVDNQAQVYLYWFEQTAYMAICTTIDHRVWLVLFSLDGVMESAFIVEHPERYLTKSAFEFVGIMHEVAP